MFDSINRKENHKKLSAQFIVIQISLIRQPFFMFFQSKFDNENKILKFHRLNEK